MAGNAPVVADREGGGVGDGDAVALAFERLEQGCQGRRAAGHELHAAVVAGQLGELGPQVAAGVVPVEGFELAEAQLVEEDGQGHQFRQAQLAPPLALFLPRGQQALFPGRFEQAAEVVHQAKKLG